MSLMTPGLQSSLSLMSEYAESYSPESLSSQSLSYDSWHPEFHSPECLSTQRFTLLNIWVCKVYLMTIGHAKFILLNAEQDEFYSPESLSF